MTFIISKKFAYFNILLLFIAISFFITGLYLVNHSASLRFSMVSEKREYSELLQKVSMRDLELNADSSVEKLHVFADKNGLEVSTDQSTLYISTGVAMNEIIK